MKNKRKHVGAEQVVTAVTYGVIKLSKLITGVSNKEEEEKNHGSGHGFMHGSDKRLTP